MLIANLTKSTMIQKAKVERKVKHLKPRPQQDRSDRQQGFFNFMHFKMFKHTKILSTGQEFGGGQILQRDVIVY